MYCNLLLERGAGAEVARRGRLFFEWRLRDDSLLTVALDHLSLGRAYVSLDELGSARGHLDDAVDGLRAAGELHYLINGLLARAAFRRAAGNLILARRDLAETAKLVERSGFRLFAADCALEQARIALAESERQGADAANAQAKLAEARAAFRRVRTLIDEMGYGRRRPELAKLARALGEREEPEAHA